MKRLVLTVLLCGLICNGTAHAGNGIGKAWEDVRRESTNAAHGPGETIGRAWEEIRKENLLRLHIPMQV